MSSNNRSSNLKPATTKNGKSKQPSAKSASLENKTPRIIWGIVFLLLSVLVFVSYFYNEGSLIVYFSNFVKGLIGYGYWAVGFCFFMLFILYCFGENKVSTFRLICTLTFPILFGTVLHLIQYGAETTVHFKDYFDSGINLLSGGVLGAMLAYYIYQLLSTVGGAIIIFIILIIQLLVILGANADTFKISGNTKVKKEDFQQVHSEKVVSAKRSNTNYSTVKSDIKASSNTNINSNKQRKISYDIPIGNDNESISPLNKSARNVSKGSNSIPVTIEKPDKDIRKSEILTTEKTKKISKKEVNSEAKKIEEEVKSSSNDAGTYVYPPASLLKYGSDHGSDSKEEILATKDRLENTLHSFGINSYITKITPGPTVTRYDIELEQGVKLSKVTNLSGDVALSLGVLNVRIAPIPDEISTVGIEVPNKIVNTVSLREIIESDNFIKAKSKLTFAIGKDIGGNSIVGNISKLPHMLIAGTTGSGKSVCMNSLIISLLYKARPDEVKFIMIDPKMVELGVYNSIPHLYVPVVTDPKKAAGALQWAVVEMLKRYRLFSDAGVRDLESYNSYCKSNLEETMPQVVIVIDELADLMMAASKEVEESICRVAQMGRAAGMHLIIATQRPSADVITGLMKANIPSRIAFAVSSAMESRIIMDTSGAEKLVGMGDMLYSPIGSGKPLRVQGAFVSDKEREDVINFIRDNCDISSVKNKELEDAMNNISKKDSPSNDDKSSVSNDYDEVLPEAVDIVLEMKSCSVSMLQRRLKLGYSRAARVVDQMEELGIVGPYEGAKPRTVLATKEGWSKVRAQLGFPDGEDYVSDSECSENYDELSSDEY